MKTVMPLVLSILVVGGTIFAANPYKPYSPRGNAAEKYYRGDMSTDEYLDSLGVPPAR
jgi:hypothetical protein